MKDRPRDLPPLDLDAGAVPVDTASHVTGRRAESGGGASWRLSRGAVAACVLAFVAGAAAGGTVVGARRDAADARTMRLAAVVTDWVVMARADPRRTAVPREGVLLTVSLHNAGIAPVTVMDVVPAGWEKVAIERRKPDDAVLQPGSWTTWTWAARPRCAATVPETLVLNILTPDGPATARLPVPEGSHALTGAWADACREPPPAGLGPT